MNAFLLSTLLMGAAIQGIPQTHIPEPPKTTLFTVQAIDTMKQSRDEARTALSDPNYPTLIDREVRMIKEANANYISIDTPYDQEFLPVLTEWVKAARKYDLKIWFRGNFSGWEEWFGYKPIDRSTHLVMLRKFILTNHTLFQDGDIFSFCPECENGGHLNKWNLNTIADYKSFLLQEYKESQDDFKTIGKSVHPEYLSMNADVAKEVMDRNFVTLSKVVTIDQYSKTSADFENRMQSLHKSSGANMAIGEFGAPIPDLNGNMNEIQQADFVSSLFNVLYKNNSYIPLVNYWVIQGGSTSLLNDDGTPRKAYDVVKKYYGSPYIYGTIHNSLGVVIPNVTISVITGSSTYTYYSQPDGKYQIFLPNGKSALVFSSSKYKSQSYVFNLQKSLNTNITLAFNYSKLIQAK